ncbi:hypothetical protein PHYBOEH_009323 [Phytophthora boehmeriae]|uniref:Uncharacterized protein n=1 Tax=Phytophthora boehmeriae TaxID=109152 RepID=A0A8T1VYT9_9STRA|nr:hypothetical protein PHYBOEH_009323 [Phytophthora boehmeriae]
MKIYPLACLALAAVSPVEAVSIRRSLGYQQQVPFPTPTEEAPAPTPTETPWQQYPKPTPTEEAPAPTPTETPWQKHPQPTPTEGAPWQKHPDPTPTEDAAVPSVDDWHDCTVVRTCTAPGSVCTQFSEFYWQCLPQTLPSGSLCGQDDGTNNWKYPYCPSGETCMAQGTEFYCTITTNTDNTESASATTTVADWGDCTGGKTCTNPTSVCVAHSQWFSQCKPATLPGGELCGQNDGTNVWRYDRCPSGQQCVAVGTDFRCRSSGSVTTTRPPTTEGTVATWGDCTGGKTCANPTSQCVAHSQWYAQCKPATLPGGELCGQRNGATPLWVYARCPTGQTCRAATGSDTDLRCQ